MSDYESSTSVETDVNTSQKIAPRWHVILLNDEEHTYEYVIALIQDVFKKEYEQAFSLTKKIDQEGQAICTTVSKERAELYQEQVKSWGADPLMLISGKMSTGAIACVIEPADEE
jgi:ATP-dependent Clp protease adaptor protein ClpS